MKYCANCIGDRYLHKTVIPNISTEVGVCSCCGSTNQILVSPGELREYFELLAGIYVHDKNGRPLIEWFKCDWSMFRVMDTAHANDLLAKIFDDKKIVQKNFSPSNLCDSDALSQWEKFCRELKHENRFFPKISLKLERLEELLSYLLMDNADIQDIWYRARIKDGDAIYKLVDMSAPPEYKASHGRANPAGIPYLYLASNEVTATSEIRPHTGEVACVANFQMAKNLKIVDLRAPRVTISPFMVGDENAVALLRGDIEFLDRLGEELTYPVLPRAAAIDYIPSQYLCEFIKECGFDGVLYRSSVGDGENIALFNPGNAKGISVKEFLVSRVSVEISENYGNPTH